MHSSDRDCAANLGIFIANGPVHPRGVDAGVVDATALQHRYRRSLPLPSPPGGPTIVTTARRRYTQHSDAADAMLAGVLDRMCGAIAEAVGDTTAVILTGSFGCGEGAVLETPSGFEIVNDLELLVVSPHDCSARLSRLVGNPLPDIGCHVLVMAWSSGGWASLAPTMPTWD